jgi:hypothetical protein
MNTESATEETLLINLRKTLGHSKKSVTLIRLKRMCQNQDQRDALNRLIQRNVIPKVGNGYTIPR